MLEQLPDWSGLIQNALKWRKDYKNKDIDHEATYPEIVRFVNFIADYIKAENRLVLPGK